MLIIFKDKETGYSLISPVLDLVKSKYIPFNTTSKEAVGISVRSKHSIYSLTEKDQFSIYSGESLVFDYRPQENTVLIECSDELEDTLHEDIMDDIYKIIRRC